MFRYNMQSGQPRGSYPQSATPSAKAVKALTNVMKPGSIAKITSDGFSSKRIGTLSAAAVVVVGVGVGVATAYERSRLLAVAVVVIVGDVVAAAHERLTLFAAVVSDGGGEGVTYGRSICTGSFVDAQGVGL